MSEVDRKRTPVELEAVDSSFDSLKNPDKVTIEAVAVDDDTTTSTKHYRPGKISTFLLVATGLLILAWWISSLIVPLSRHRWLVQTLWAWFFVLVIIFRFVPASVVSRPVSAVWTPLIANPISNFPSRARLVVAWVAAIAITFSTAFAAPLPSGTQLSDRVISLAGVYFYQLVLVANSVNRQRINWIRIPISIILQQAIALFVLKSDAGFKLVAWFHTAVADFLEIPVEATALVFDPDITKKGWFFVNTLGIFIFFGAWVSMLYAFGWMQWFTKQFAWFGSRVLNASGAETFVALWSPWFGQINSALLIAPYLQDMTDSEIFAIMATSMATMSSYSIRLFTTPQADPSGLLLRPLLAQSAILLPSAIINAKTVWPEPEPEKVVTRSRESTAAYSKEKINASKAIDLLEALCDGAWTGLKVAGGVLTNFFMVLGILVFLHGFLVWTFRAFSVHAMDPHLIGAAILTPLTFFLGVPREEVWPLAKLLSVRLINGTDAVFPMAAKAGLFTSKVGRTMAVWGALGNTASLPSLGMQMGGLTALVPGRKLIISRAVLPAVIIATVSSFQAAAIAASMY